MDANTSLDPAPPETASISFSAQTFNALVRFAHAAVPDAGTYNGIAGNLFCNLPPSVQRALPAHLRNACARWEVQKNDGGTPPPEAHR